VVADDVDVDPARAAISNQVALLEERRRHGGQHDVERDRLNVIGLEPEPDLFERFDDFEMDGPDRGFLGRRGEFTAAPHRPLLLASGYATEAVDDPSVLVLPEAEVHLQ
jgi:hypothetical protein